MIFEQRIELMRGQEISETVDDMREQVIEDLIHANIPPNAYAEQWDVETLHQKLGEALAIDFPVSEWAEEEGIAEEEIRERVTEAANSLYAAKREKYGAELMHEVEKSVLLQIIDQLWREHLLTLEHLRQSIGLRASAQRDPLNEYKTECFNLFAAMIARLREVTTANLMRIELAEQPPEDFMLGEDDLPEMEAHHIDPFTGEDDITGSVFGERPKPGERNASDPSTWGKVGRNEKCPCGSGKKFKHCHGALV